VTPVDGSVIDGCSARDGGEHRRRDRLGNVDRRWPADADAVASVPPIEPPMTGVILTTVAEPLPQPALVQTVPSSRM
jgi:hypothetical protein